ncbi:MAG: FixH family protein [Hyphomonadaceae bacterium]
MSSAAPKLRGWHVLGMLLAFFGAVIAVNVFFAVVAVESFPGEDVPRSYAQGLEYNQTLAERRAQAALGWSVTAGLADTGRGADLEVTLTDGSGAAVVGAELTGALQWPANASLDRDVRFESAGAGRYVAHLGALHRGRWRLRGRAVRGESARDFEAELPWPASL